MPSDRRARRRLSLAFVTLLALPHFARAQQQPPPPRKPSADAEEVVRVTTELVQTDVSVFDREGKFVDNLKADQFELKVDGRVQPVSFFERVVAGSVNEDAQLAAARGTSRGGGAGGGSQAALPLDRGRVVVFFIDDLHLSQQSLLKAKAMLARFIDTRLGQNDLMAIAAASNQLGFLSQLTDDKHVLKTAAARLSSREYRDFDADRPQMNIVQAIAIDENRPDVLDYFIDQSMKENPVFSGGNLESARQQAALYVRRRASQIIDLHSAVATRTLDSLRGVMKTFAQAPGRKLVYFVSDGFALELRRSGTYERLRQVTDAAVRAGAVVYTVDARGLGAQLADLPSAADNSSPDSTGRLAGAGLSMTAASQEPLRTIAGETGGRAILNTESVEAGVAKALKDTSVYYLLAWKPEREENRGGKFRRVEVSVRARPDLTVLVQRGFYLTPPEEPRRREDAKAGASGGAASTTSPADDPRYKELFAALRSPLPRAGVPTALTLNYLRAKDAEMVLAMSVQVDIEASKPAAGGAPQTDRIDLLVAIYDAQGKVVYTNAPNRSITPKDAAVPVPEVYRVTFPVQTTIKPGLYQVRVASRDPKNRRTGSASQWIEVPDVGKGGFSLSSVFLGVRPYAATDAKVDAAAPQVLVVADRRFARDSPVRFLVYTYNAATAPDGGKPDVALQVQVFRDDQPVITAPLRKIDVEGLTDYTRLPYAAELSMRGVPAGRYVLRVTAIDRIAKASASQGVKFSIE